MSKIMDQNGRLGVITEDRGHGVFARPEGVDYCIDDVDGVTGVPGAKIITATWWTRMSDGKLRGRWHGSNLYDSVDAVML